MLCMRACAASPARKLRATASGHGFKLVRLQNLQAVVPAFGPLFCDDNRMRTSRAGACRRRPPPPCCARCGPGRRSRLAVVALCCVHHLQGLRGADQVGEHRSASTHEQHGTQGLQASQRGACGAPEESGKRQRRTGAAASGAGAGHMGRCRRCISSLSCGRWLPHDVHK